MSVPGEKRRAREYDAKLVRVARALESVIRDGATFTHGASGQFPPPAIAFRGQNRELQPPLRADDVEKIKAHGAVAQQHEKKVVAWEVDGGVVESRNPRWHSFLTHRLTEMRAELGIAATAAVEIKLSKLRLVEAGGSLVPLRRDDRKRARAGVFGSLLVVLPGAFEGGDLVVHGQSMDQHQQDDVVTKQDGGSTTATWRPSVRDSAYELSFAAFYDCCACSAEPVERGTALCLVYDLATTTPVEVPLFLGPTSVQHAVESSLREYFDNVSAPVAKRLKISPNVWRTINEFTADRHFAYIVDAPSFDKLSDNERKIADSLEAFCAQSEGQYVLYLARVLCSRYSHTQPINERTQFYDDRVNEMSVTLRGPWIKSDESDTSSWMALPTFFPIEQKLSRLPYPPVFLRHVNEVAPLGRVEEFTLKMVSRYMDETNYTIIDERHGDCDKAGYFETHALVVQPAAVELSQGAKLPDRAIVARLRALLDESRDEALQYARRVLYHRPAWRVNGRTIDNFQDFIQVVVDINDRELFLQLLHTAEMDRTVYNLRGATVHFGWDACEESIIKRILSTPSLSGRVNLAVSVLRNRSHLDDSQVNRVLDALLSLHPWTDVKAGPHDKPHKHPSPDAFGHLLLLATSRSRIQKLTSVTTDPELMVRVVARAVINTVRGFPDRELPRWAVLSCWEHYQPMIAKLRNDLYKKVFIVHDCPKCEELRAFVRSEAPDTTVSYTDEAEREHIEYIMDHEAREPALVKIEPAGMSRLQLTKIPKPAFGCLLYHAQSYEKDLIKLISGG